MTPSQRQRLDALIRAVCPIDGTSGDPPRIDFADEATTEQRAAAQQVADSFDRSDAAQQQWEADQQPERKSLRQAAAQALADNAAYLALANPTAAQVRQQADALTRQMNAVIRRLIQLD